MQGPPGYPQQPHGYPPQGYPQQGYYPPQPPPKKGMSGWAIAGLVVLGLFAGCGAICAVGIKGAGDKAAADKKAFDDEEAIVVKPEDLRKAYEENEIAGDKKYKGKKIRMTGEIESIDSDFNDQPMIQLKSGEMFKSISVNGLSKDDAAALKKGEKITVECKGDGEIIGMPRLSDCDLK